jgi:HlyD family secretion protein
MQNKFLLRNKKSLLLTVVFALPVVLILISERTAAPEVIVVKPEQGELKTELSDFGTTKFNNAFTVVAPANGWISKPAVSLGENVTANKSVLFSMTAGPSPLLDARSRATLKAQAESAHFNVRQSLASVRKIQSNLEYAQKELTRNESVYRAGAISQHDIEIFRSKVVNLTEELRAAKAGYQAAAHLYEASRAALDAPDSTNAELRSVLAPRSGVISWIYDDKQRWVSTGVPLADVARTGDLSFELDLPAREAMQVRSGMRVRFSDFASGGRVRSISPTALPKISPLGISEQRTRVWIDFTDAPESTVPAGLELEAHIEIAARDNALKIPVTSHWIENGNSFVFVVSKGRLSKRQIKTGLKNLRETEVTEGLSAAETVVRLPSENMKQGDKVTEKYE